MARSRRLSGADWVKLVAAAVIAVGIGTGAFVPALQAGITWASPFVIAASQAFGEMVVQLFLPSR